MTTELLPRVDAAPAVAPDTPAKTAGPSPDGSTFQRLLESLQQLRTTGRAVADANDPGQLRDAIRAADDGFVTAMDLRKRLEEAFRNRLP
ncbi:MAG: hypothetical protein JNK78_03295 [Planctomycetes bacterium]|nr:hypothetical protein [Planctomycetota bacterium]